MAHKRAGAYYPPDSEPGLATLELREAFLRAVKDVCPRALDEYRGLTPDGVAAWARRYHLDAEWLIEAALAGLRIARSGGPARPYLFTVFTTPDEPPPGTPIELTYRWLAYVGEGDPSTFRRQHIEAFTNKLDEQLNAAVKRLDEREAAGGLLRAGFPDARTRENIEHAARWQTLGESVRDGKTLRTILRRIGLKPRPGLA